MRICDERLGNVVDLFAGILGIFWGTDVGYL
jgi:hypothetical protein